jgi:excisionase family DNA binding protein
MTAALKKDWYKAAAKEAEDLDKIRSRSARAKLTPVPDVTERVPPFRGLSRLPLLTYKEACEKLEICMTTLRALIKRRMIFPHGRGRKVRIPIEECERYAEREVLLRMERNA